MTKHLTPREIEIVILIASGLTAKQIAARLPIARATVKSHTAHVHEKLDICTNIQLTRYALKTGLVTLEVML